MKTRRLSLRRDYHTSFLAPEPLSQLDHAAGEELRELIQLHAEKTGSTRAQWILSDWSNLSSGFVRLTPLPQGVVRYKETAGPSTTLRSGRDDKWGAGHP